MRCPMCDLDESVQKPVLEEPGKTKCKGCGSIFFDKSRK